MNDKTKDFKPDAITIEFGDEKFSLFFDLNCFCEMEKIYDSVDSVIQMLLGTDAIPNAELVTYNGVKVFPAEIRIGDTTLDNYMRKIEGVREAKHTDTRNLLWLGCLHDHTIFNEHGEITGYTITKEKLGTFVSLKNIREVNAKIVTAIIRDLLPATQEAKNVEVPEQQEPQNLVLNPE